MSHEQNQTLIDAMTNCAAECNHCVAACLEEEAVTMLARCIKLDIDCAEICMLAASYISRGSESGQHILNACAKVCEACADECEKHSHMDHCKKCANVCRACAELCNQGITA